MNNKASVSYSLLRKTIGSHSDYVDQIENYLTKAANSSYNYRLKGVFNLSLNKKLKRFNNKYG